jgi:hypothetical protein
MIKYVYWQWAAKHEEQREDGELFDVLHDAYMQNENGTALVESITLPDGSLLKGIGEIETHYEHLKQEGKQ